MLKFSANLSMLFSEAGLLERFKLAKQHGFAAVEIQFPYTLDAQVIAEELASQDLKLVLFNVAADDLLQGGEGLACVPEKKAQFQDAVCQAVDYAKILQPVAVNVLPGRCLDQHKYDEYLQTFKDNLRFAEQAFSAVGIKTVFEAINNHDMPGFIINTAGQMLQVLDELNLANLSMQYDVYHAVMMGGDPAAFIGQHAGRIGHIQFADCPGRAEPGTGRIDFAEIFAMISKSSYTGWVGAEYKPSSLSHESLAWFSPFKAKPSAL